MFRLFIFLTFFYAELGWANSMWQQTSNIPLSSIQGSSTTLENYPKNRPKYIKFWASWCQPCVKQMAHFQSINNTYSDKIDVIAINIDINDTREDIIKVQTKYGLSMPILIDHSGQLAQAYDLIGTPLSVLLDSSGSVVYKSHNADEALDEQLKQLILAPSKKASLNTNAKNSTQYHFLDSKKSAVLFTSTWCDWYLEKSRPKTSQNCIKANKMIDTLAAKNKQFDWSGLVSRLWTHEKELNEFKDKYQLKLPLAIDNTNEAFVQFKINKYPTLVVFEEGKVVKSIENFDSIDHILAELK